MIKKLNKNKKSWLTLILVSVFALAFFVSPLLVPKAHAASTYFAIASGNWNSNTTWSLSSGGGAVGAGIWPVAGDTVNIGEANTARVVTVPAGFSAAAATINIGSNSFNRANSLALTSTGSLTVSGNVTVNRPSGGSTNSLNVDGGTAMISGNLAFIGTATNTNRITEVIVTTGSLTVGGNFTMDAGSTLSNLITMSGGAGTFNLGGAFTFTVGTLAAGTTSTFNFNGTSAQTIPIGVDSVIYNNLNVNNTNASGATLSAAVTAANVTGNRSVGNISSGSLLNTGNFNVTYGNSKTLTVASGSTLNAGTSIETFGTSGTVTINGTFKTANTVGFSGSATTAINSTNTPTITLGGSSTIEYNSGVAQAVTARTDYANLTFSGAGTKTTASGTITASGTWSDSSTTALNTNNTIVNVTGNLTGTGAITQGTGLITVGGDWSNTGAFTASSVGVTLTGTGKSIVGASGGITFTTLTVNGTYTNNNSTAITVSTALSGSGTFNNDGGTLNISGTSGITTLTASSLGSLVNYNAAGAQTIKATTYNNLTISGSGTKILGGATVVNANLNISAGTLDVDSTNNYALSVGGTWTNTPGGTSGFLARAGTVTFNGTSGSGAGNQTINSANTWYNLAVTGTTARTVSFQSSVLQTVSNSLTLTGASGQLLFLSPLTAATTWLLHAPATQTINYVQPSYSDASGGTVINAAGGTGNVNGGNNTNWNFSPPTIPPSAINQYKTDGTTVITQGTGQTNQSQVVFKATATDPDGNTYRLEVEVIPNANSYVNGATCVSSFVASGSEASTGACGTLTNGVSYKWQYRLVDVYGAATAWTAFGASDPDFTADTSSPTVTINQAGGQPDPTNSTINFTAIFNESVTGFATGDVSFTGSTIPGHLTGTVSGGPAIFNVAVTGMTPGTVETVVASINAGVATDLAGNANLASTSTDNTVVYDNIAPTFAIQYYSNIGLTVPIADNTQLKAGTYYVKITANKPLASAPTVSSIFAEGTANNVTNGTTTLVSGNDYKYTRTIVFDAAATGATREQWLITGTDTAGNTATNVAPTNESTKAMYTDTVAPTVTINQKVGQADPTAVSPVEFTVTFSENTADFATGDVNLTSSTTPGTLVGTVTGGPSIYNVAVTGMTGSGNVIASIDAGVAHDTAGNGNLGSTSVDNTVAYVAGFGISGTTNLADGYTVKVAVGGVLQAQTGTTGSGAWTITGVVIPVNSIITVFINGSNISTAVTKQAGTEGNITGMVLDNHTLSVGDAGGKSLVLTDFDLYDYNNNSNVMHSYNVTTLTVDASNTFTDEKINILSGNSLTVSGTETLDTFSLLINGTLTSGGASIYNVDGDWTNNGTFTASTSTVNLTGANQAVSGSTTFNNFTKTIASADTLTFAAVSTQTFTGVLTLQGAPSPSTRLSLRSSSPGTQWNIDPHDGVSVTWVDVQDSNNINATAITTANSVDSLNNINWVFAANYTGTVFTDEGITPIASGKTVSISINGGPVTSTTTGVGGTYTLNVVANPGDKIVIYLDGNTEKGSLVSYTAGSASGMDIYQNHVNLRGTVNVTNAHFATANNGDPDILYTTSGGDLTFTSGIEFYIWPGRTFQPGGNVTVTDLDIRGTFLPEANTINVSGNWSLDSAATFTAGTSTVNFNGTGVQSIGGSGTTIFNNLTINNSAGVSGNSNLTVNGVLTLDTNLSMGANTLTMGGSATTVGIGDVIGIVKRTSFVAETEYSFGNQFTTMTISTGGVMPTDISFKISIGSAPTWKTNAVQREYDIVRTGGSGNTAILKLHYLDSELNGNTETDLVQWDYHTNIPLIEEHGTSGKNATDNWVQISNRSIGYFATTFGFRPWALSDTEQLPFTWLGSVSSDWTDSDNWSNGIVPILTSAVIIPDSATTDNDPTLPASTTILTLDIKSGGILNGGSGILTIAGNSGALLNEGGTINPGTSTITFTGTNATITGTNDLYNLTIGGGAALTNDGASITRIGGAMTNSGTWNADTTGANTVEYNGAAQTIINPNGANTRYHH
ncbi:MAG: hypothetical protein PHU42_04195, partial [Patescibacteria group bacterium]|nr:hypothetical protein [Patescibacteria group bacterium]